MPAESDKPPGSWWQQIEAEEHSARPEPETVWSYRGYKLKASEFNTALVHYFRSQVNRADVWRRRLDATTNWAVVTTGATISIAFSRGLGSHSVILLNTILITLFLFIEARRYRFYELWSSRVRLLETDFFAAMLVPPFHPAADWAESLAENLLHPQFTISLWEAVGRRYRRNYVWIYVTLALAWVANVWLYPMPAQSWEDFLNRAVLGPLTGWMMIALGAIFNLTLLFMGVVTVGLQAASGEVLPRFESMPVPIWTNGKGVGSHLRKSWRAWFRPSQHRQQLLAVIITEHAETLGKRILDEMQRGATSLAGTGMYTGEARSVLLCALTVTEVAHLRAVVNDVDPQAFLVVSPVQEILGSGFSPLQETSSKTPE